MLPVSRFLSLSDQTRQKTRDLGARNNLLGLLPRNPQNTPGFTRIATVTNYLEKVTFKQKSEKHVNLGEHGITEIPGSSPEPPDPPT